MSDIIESLPTDNDPLESEEKYIIETILQKDATKFQKFIHEIKLPIIAGILFLLINSPQVSSFLKDNVSYARSSDMSLLCFKAAIFMVALFIYSNLHYVMK